MEQRLTRTLSIATDEGLRGQNALHSLRVHSCASMLNNICSGYELPILEASKWKKLYREVLYV